MTFTSYKPMTFTRDRLRRQNKIERTTLQCIHMTAGVATDSLQKYRKHINLSDLTIIAVIGEFTTAFHYEMGSVRGNCYYLTRLTFPCLQYTHWPLYILCQAAVGNRCSHSGWMRRVSGLYLTTWAPVYDREVEVESGGTVGRSDCIV